MSYGVDSFASPTLALQEALSEPPKKRKEQSRVEEKDGAFRVEGVAMAVPFVIVVGSQQVEQAAGRPRSTVVENVASEVFSVVDSVLNPFSPNSTLSLLNQHALRITEHLAERWTPWISVPKTLWDVLCLVSAFCEATDGLFDPSIAPAVAFYRHEDVCERCTKNVHPAPATVKFLREQIDDPGAITRSAQPPVGFISKGASLPQGICVPKTDAELSRRCGWSKVVRLRETAVLNGDVVRMETENRRNHMVLFPTVSSQSRTVHERVPGRSATALYEYPLDTVGRVGSAGHESALATDGDNSSGVTLDSEVRRLDAMRVGQEGKTQTVPLAPEGEEDLLTPISSGATDASSRSSPDECATERPQRFYQVRLAAGAYIDLSGVAKGLAIDAVIGALRESGFSDGYVDWGGDIRAFGSHPGGSATSSGVSAAGRRPWTAAIRRPPKRPGQDVEQKSVSNGRRLTTHAILPAGSPVAASPPTTGPSNVEGPSADDFIAVDVSDVALCTSGDYLGVRSARPSVSTRSHGGDSSGTLSHIVDPRTLRVLAPPTGPPTTIDSSRGESSASIAYAAVSHSSSCAVADAIATALLPLRDPRDAAEAVQRWQRRAAASGAAKNGAASVPVAHSRQNAAAANPADSGAASTRAIAALCRKLPAPFDDPTVFSPGRALVATPGEAARDALHFVTATSAFTDPLDAAALRAAADHGSTVDCAPPSAFVPEQPPAELPPLAIALRAACSGLPRPVIVLFVQPAPGAPAVGMALSSLLPLHTAQWAADPALASSGRDGSPAARSPSKITGQPPVGQSPIGVLPASAVLVAVAATKGTALGAVAERLAVTDKAEEGLAQRPLLLSRLGGCGSAGSTGSPAVRAEASSPSAGQSPGAAGAGLRAVRGLQSPSTAASPRTITAGAAPAGSPAHDEKIDQAGSSTSGSGSGAGGTWPRLWGLIPITPTDVDVAERCGAAGAPFPVPDGGADGGVGSRGVPVQGVLEAEAVGAVDVGDHFLIALRLTAISPPEVSASPPAGVSSGQQHQRALESATPSGGSASRGSVSAGPSPTRAVATAFVRRRGHYEPVSTSAAVRKRLEARSAAASAAAAAAASVSPSREGVSLPPPTGPVAAVFARAAGMVTAWVGGAEKFLGVSVHGFEIVSLRPPRVAIVVRETPSAAAIFGFSVSSAAPAVGGSAPGGYGAAASSGPASRYNPSGSPAGGSGSGGGTAQSMRLHLATAAELPAVEWFDEVAATPTAEAHFSMYLEAAADPAEAGRYEFDGAAAGPVPAGATASRGRVLDVAVSAMPVPACRAGGADAVALVVLDVVGGALGGHETVATGASGKSAATKNKATTGFAFALRTATVALP